MTYTSPNKTKTYRRKHLSRQHNQMPVNPNIPHNLSLPVGYPHTIFNNTLQIFKNPIKHCHHACACAIRPLLISRCFAESTTLEQKVPINLPHPKQFFNKNVIHLITTRGIISKISKHLTKAL